MSIRKRFARLEFLRRKTNHSAVGRSSRALNVERLEDRRMMSADDSLAGGLAIGIGEHHTASDGVAEKVIVAPFCYDEVRARRVVATESAEQASSLPTEVLPVASGDDVRPNSVASCVPADAPSQVPKQKVGRAAAIAQLAHARTFGNVNVARCSPLTANLINVVVQAVHNSATQSNPI